jgi:hypothetical protein
MAYFVMTERTSTVCTRRFASYPERSCAEPLRLRGQVGRRDFTLVRQWCHHDGDFTIATVSVK